MPVRISKNRVALENIPLNLAAEADVASAATCNIGAALSNNVRITGTTTITAFDTVAAGIFRFIRFAGALTLTHNSTTLKLPGSANITTSADDRAIARSFGSGNWEVFDYTKSSGEAVVGSGNTYNLTNIIYPRADGDWRGIYRGGWRPAFFNQQWGGAQWGNGPDGSLVDFATGYITDNALVSVADATGSTWRARAFKLSVADSIPAVWVKIYKTGNPANNLQLYVLPDDGSGTKPTGSTPVTNGTATAQSGKLHTANTNGEWVRFVFPTPPSLSANTTYWVALKSSGAVDASNYWNWKRSTVVSYPHGKFASGDGTPTWGADSGTDTCFLVESSTSTKFLQPSGQFSGKLAFAEGSPLDQSKGLSQPLKNFFDGYEFTYRGVFTTLTKDKTVADFLYGLDHDRVVLRCNATTGYLQVDVYESDGTKHTVTGTTDCSSGTKDIAIYIRAKGDGSDSVKLYVNGTSEGTPVASATITFDTNFKDLGTAWLGGGFPIAPTWTKDTAMGSLPSADGWTYTGTATEGNVFSVSGGKLYQNYTGYAATDTGYYSRTTSLSNANGWVVAWKAKVTKATNVTNNIGVSMMIYDGAKQVIVHAHEYFVEITQFTSDFRPKVQMNLTDREHTFLAIGKGSDFFLFIDGKLIIDGVGLMTIATATNQITFGDNTATSDVNGGGVWDYVKDYNTAWLPPQFTSGSCSEAAFFSGDRTGILSSLYNGGTLKSVREYCGVEREYIERVHNSHIQKGIISSPTTTSTGLVLLTDLEMFVFAEEIDFTSEAVVYNSAAGNEIYYDVSIDGVKTSSNGHFVQQDNAAYENAVNQAVLGKSVPASLHKIETRWAASAGTNTAPGGDSRHMSVRTK